MNSSPVITFHGGIDTIGGTKIFVQEGEHRVLFDFGLNFAPGGDFWGGTLEPRPGAGGLRDYITLGYAPAVDGLYRHDQAPSLGLKPGRGETTQVFISHLHLDHMALVDRLAPEIPVWMHRESLQLFRAVAATGEPPAVPAGARPFEWGETIRVGPIQVTPVAVDHDIPGATALLITTSAGTVVYSGDLRLHGPRPDRVAAFVAAARATRPKILLLEGTRMGEGEPGPDRPPALSEDDVPGALLSHLSGATGKLAFLTLYPRNTYRVEGIARAVREAGRTLALSAEAAHIYLSMGGEPREILVYLREKDRGPNGDPWFLTPWFEAGLLPVDAAAVRSNPGAYLLQLFPGDLNELVDLKPEPGAVFIHSNGEPLGRFDPMWELFMRWLGHFGVELKRAPSPGHATPEDLFGVIGGIAAEVLMPIHSRLPELMHVAGQRRVLPELGATYAIATGKRVE